MRMLKKLGNQCQDFDGHLGLTHIPISQTEHVVNQLSIRSTPPMRDCLLQVIHGFRDYFAMEQFLTQLYMVEFGKQVHRLGLGKQGAYPRATPLQHHPSLC